MLFLLFTASINTYGQKIVHDGVDKFTKIYSKKTSSEKLHRDYLYGGWVKASTKMVVSDTFESYIDTNIAHYLILDIIERVVFSIGLDNSLYLLLEDGNSIPLKCDYGGVAFITGSMYRLKAIYYIPNEYIPLLKKQPLIEIRIVTTRGAFEYRIKGDRQSIVSNELKLLTH